MLRFTDRLPSGYSCTSILMTTHLNFKEHLFRRQHKTFLEMWIGWIWEIGLNTKAWQLKSVKDWKRRGRSKSSIFFSSWKLTQRRRMSVLWSSHPKEAFNSSARCILGILFGSRSDPAFDGMEPRYYRRPRTDPDTCQQPNRPLRISLPQASFNTACGPLIIMRRDS